MTVTYGLNPSFTNSRLPLFADPIKRGRFFQVFDAQGNPTPERSQLRPDGWPVNDGRNHGLRVFEDMGGHMPALPLDTWRAAHLELTFREKAGESLAIYGKAWIPTSLRLRNTQGRWHIPSAEALAWLRPKILRTLDWQRTNARPAWTRPRASVMDILQGDVMAAELQREAAQGLRCVLWFPAPPRFELSVADYEVRLEEILRAIYDPNGKAPILEYGNELWNDSFPVNGWLKAHAPAGQTWHTVAADEIATLTRVADRVFGPHGELGKKSWYLFVGGQLAVPSHLDRILEALGQLGIAPDLAGPALYVGPSPAQREEWEAAGATPTQDELEAACLGSIDLVGRKLREHGQILKAREVQYLACYEAGQSMIAGSSPWRKVALAAQSQPWMGDLYRTIRLLAESEGVEILNWYSACTSQAPQPGTDVFGLLDSFKTDAPLPKASAARGD